MDGWMIGEVDELVCYFSHLRRITFYKCNCEVVL